MCWNTLPDPRARRLACAVLAVFVTGACGGDDAPAPAENPVPVLASVEPSQLELGLPVSEIELTGQGFVRASKVTWNGVEHPSTYVSATRLRVPLAEADLAETGPVTLTVVNPPPGGGATAPALLERVNARPRIDSISPSQWQSRGGNFTLTVFGSGFVRGSEIRWDGQRISPTTFVSAERLTMEVGAGWPTLLGWVTISVESPPPSGGRSNLRSFRLVKGAPSIITVLPDSVEAGTAATVEMLALRAYDSSVATWNGLDVSTVPDPNYVNPFRVTIPATQLATAGTGALALRNTGDDGASSVPVTVRVVAARPVIEEVVPSVLAAGSAGATLTLRVRSLPAGATVHVNGSPRATTAIDGSRLRADLPAGDLVAPGTVQVTVVSAASASQPIGVGVVAAGPSLGSPLVLPIRNTHLIADHGRGRILAAVPGSATAHARSVVEIDPATGTVVGAIPIVGDPLRLALTDDGRYLYVSLRDAPTVVRIDMTTRVEHRRIAVDWPRWPDYVYAEDLATLPGYPLRFVAALRLNAPLVNGTGFPDGVYVFNDTLGHRLGSLAGWRVAALRDNAVVGAREGLLLRGAFWSDGKVEGAWIVGTQFRPGHVLGSRDIALDAGRLFLPTGLVVDPLRLTRIDSIPASGIVVPDVARGRVHFLDADSISTFHPLTRAAVGRFAHPALAGLRTLARWGTDGLVAGGGDAIVILRGPLAGP